MEKGHHSSSVIPAHMQIRRKTLPFTVGFTYGWLILRHTEKEGFGVGKGLLNKLGVVPENCCWTNTVPSYGPKIWFEVLNQRTQCHHKREGADTTGFNLETFWRYNSKNFLDSEDKWPGFKYQLYHLLPLWPWADPFHLLCICFLISKRGIKIVLISQSCDQD